MVGGWWRSLASAFALLPLVACGGVTNDAAGEKYCEHQGNSYAIDEVFPSDDGCNSCRCGADLQVSCGLLPCQLCRDMEAQHATEVQQLKACDPAAVSPCSRRFIEGLSCGCETFGNSDFPLPEGHFTYTDVGCGSRDTCGACLTPVTATCSPEGRCVDSFEPGSGAACQVAGIVYPSGSIDIRHPDGRKGCSCLGGRIVCYDISCPEPCPGSTTFGSQCAQCGAGGECLIVETGCFATCTESCESGPCENGVCVRTCL